MWNTILLKKARGFVDTEIIDLFVQYLKLRHDVTVFEFSSPFASLYRKLGHCTMGNWLYLFKQYMCVSSPYFLRWKKKRKWCIRLKLLRLW